MKKLIVFALLILTWKITVCDFDLTAEEIKEDYENLEILFDKYACSIDREYRICGLQKDSIKGWEYIESKLIEVDTKTVNFGGQFILIGWGCGTNCQTGIIIDASSGTMYWLPTSERGIEYRKDSKLLIVNPPLKGQAKDLRPEYASPAYYYLTEDHRFILLES